MCQLLTILQFRVIFSEDAHRRSILLACAMRDHPNIKRKAGATPLTRDALFRSPAYTSPISTAQDQAMSARHAACSCGQLHLTLEGEPARISMCHCLACQRRTGAVISNQARFRRAQVTIAGKATTWTRTAESGSLVTFHFCPTCGSTVYWESESFPGYIVVAIGNFADPNFPAPTIAVWEESRHPWVSLPPDTPPNRMPRQG